MNHILVSGVIIGVGILFFLILILRNKWKITHKDIQEYEDGRDKLTFREKEVKEVEEPEGYSGGMLGNLIGGFIVLLIGINLLPEIQKQVTVANISSTGSTLLGLTSIFFVLGVVALAISMVANGLRNGGML